jgi:hypothetical protein
VRWVACLDDPAQPALAGIWSEMETAAPSLALRVLKVPVHAREIEMRRRDFIAGLSSVVSGPSIAAVGSSADDTTQGSPMGSFRKSDAKALTRGRTL